MNKAIGEKVKHLRQTKNMTLKDLSEQTGLSTGFLSQLERGMTSIAVDSLSQLANVLETDLHAFFPRIDSGENAILRYQERKLFQIENQKFMHYHLSNAIKGKHMLPRLVEILPGETDDTIDVYGHQGEEFVYVLEGCLTLFLGNEKHVLHPRDSAHYTSNEPHNWANYTNQVVKLLVVASPNPFADASNEVR